MPRYLRHGNATLSPDRCPITERVADQGSQGPAPLPGYQDVIFFLDEERNAYGAFSIGESREAAERADAQTPQFEQALAAPKGRSRPACTRATSTSVDPRVRGWNRRWERGIPTGFACHPGAKSVPPAPAH